MIICIIMYYVVMMYLCISRYIIYTIQLALYNSIASMSLQSSGHYIPLQYGGSWQNITH